MWYLSPEKTKQKLKFLANLESYDINHPLVQMGGARPHALHTRLEDLRANHKDSELIKKVEQVAMLLAEFILDNHEGADDLIWIVRDLLGHSPTCFSTIPLNTKQIELISKRINRHRHTYYPYVILARYVPTRHRKSLVKIVIDYANHPESLKPWVSTGEACETLGFLNAFPVASMHCLAHHLNDAGNNSMPGTQILKVMPLFKKHVMLAVDSLKNHLIMSIEGENLKTLDCTEISKLVVTTQLARTLKPIFEQVLNEWKILEHIQYQENDSEYNNQLLALYGQLCYLAEQQ